MKIAKMAKHTDGIGLFYAKDRQAWRNWLEKNSQKKKSVWLVYYKPASGKTRVNYNDAVDEAICYGWIDSKPNKLDALRSIQFFAPRNPKSSWSRINKARVERLVKEGRMTERGFAVIQAARQNGAWDALNKVEEMMIPADLEKAFRKNKRARDYFMAFPRSSKKNILEWIDTAKKSETRKKRVEETVRLAATNIRANHYRQPANSAK